MTVDFAIIEEKLRAHELKVTQQRLVIGKNLAEHDDHPTAEKIYEEVRVNNPAISLATVYKTLDSFVKAGLACKVGTTEGKARYDANLEPHDHLYCEESQKIMDFKSKELHGVIAEYLQNLDIENFEINDFQLQINGKVLEKDKPVFVKNQ